MYVYIYLYIFTYETFFIEHDNINYTIIILEIPIFFIIYKKY